MTGKIARPYDQPFIDDCTSDEDDQESLKANMSYEIVRPYGQPLDDSTSDEDDQESLKANRMSLPKISSKETIENQIEGNGKRIASVEKELNLKAETTIVKKKDIEEEVQRNTKRIECLEKELDEIRRSKTITEELEKRIKALEEEKQDLYERNKELEKKLQEMDKELQEVRERLKKIEKQNKEKDARIEKLERDRDYDHSVLILTQIGTTLQRNRCKYVLGKYFKDAFFYKYGKIDDYIKRLVPARDQKSAKKRLKELDEKFPWDQDLVDSLKHLKGARNNMAHPKLSSKEIQKATKHLKKINEINDEMVENIMELKALWKTSEDLLRSTVRSRTRREIRRSPSISQKKRVRKRAAPKDDSKSKERQALIKKAKR